MGKPTGMYFMKRIIWIKTHIYIYTSMKMILLSNLSERIFPAKKSQLVGQVMCYSWLQMKYLHTQKKHRMKCLRGQRPISGKTYFRHICCAIWNIWEKQLAQYPPIPGTHDAMIRSVLRQNDVATSFWRNDNVTYCVVCPLRCYLLVHRLWP